MKFKFASVFLLIIITIPAFTQDFSITEEIYSDELSSLAVLEINSLPDTAEIYIDDDYRGNTDIECPLPNDGPHQLELIKPGYDDLVINFTSDKNTGLIIDAVLKRQTGTLNIETIPDTAEITADDTALAQGANILPTGSYTVQITGKGFKTHVENIRIYNGAESELSVELAAAAEETETTSEKQPEAGRYPFSSIKSGSPGLICCPGASVLNPGELQFFTGFSYKEAAVPFSAGFRVSPLSGLEVCGIFRAFVSLNFSEDTATGGGLSVKYSFTDSSAPGLNLAAMLSGSLISAEDGSSYNSLNSISAALPAGFTFYFGDIHAGFTAAPGISGSLYLGSGESVSSPALKLLTPAGIFINGEIFSFGISAEPDYPEFGYGFPGIDGLRAAAEAAFGIPGRTSSFSIFCALDFSTDTDGLTASGFEAGVAVSFISF